jgi:minor extracellular serine protease Vpr
MTTRVFAISAFLFATFFAAGTPAAHNRYALILSRPPAAQQFASVQGMQAAAANYSDAIRMEQAALRRELESRSFHVTGAAQVLLNAIFVEASPDRMAELRALPGVAAVAPLHRYRMRADTVAQLQNLPAAWSALGGTGSAGAGMKIAIIDSGIDQTRPSFQDPALAPPPGFPRCGVRSDCAFTNSKVIVARSYVHMLAAGSPPDPAATSRPDDLSARDRVGHGTGLAGIAAGVPVTGPAGPMTGMAPKAFLGNYKVFGSPGVNDYTTGDVVIAALEDAVEDGMDMAVLSLGAPAMSGPFDTGALCGETGSTPCDPEAQAIENAIRGAGIVVAVANGNSGDSGVDVNGNSILTPNTIETPAIVPSAIAAGASTNSQTFVASVRINDSGAPSNIAVIPAVFGDGPTPPAAITAPLVDVATLDRTGFACSALPAGSLNGALALVVRSSQVCPFSTKVFNAQDAGAVGVVIISSSDSLFTPGGLWMTNIPAVLIAQTEGTALQSYVGSHPGLEASLDPGLTPVPANPYNTVADFSSRGPSITYLAKPDVVGVGTDVYLATQTLDPDGVLYDPSGYTAASGTSFTAPMAAGIAALVKQRNPGLSGVQIKSAVVNTATQDITDNGTTAGVTAAGDGKLNAGSALTALVTADPASVSFGAIGGKDPSLPVSRQMTVHYAGSTPATVALSVEPKSGPLAPIVDKTSLVFQPGGADQTVTLTLSGSTPSPGSYEGAILLTGAGAVMRVPYFYVVGNGIPYAIVPLTGIGFDNLPGESVPGGLGFKVVDRYGVAVQGLPVRFATSFGGGTIGKADTVTNAHGIATAGATVGSTPGAQEFYAAAGPFFIPFDGMVRTQPAITPNGVVNAASGLAGAGIAPGSYIAIYGTGLADATGETSTATLPMSLNYTTVSFDVPSAGISVPGRLIYASSGQVNVQAPWELAGQSSVRMKVSIQDTPGLVYTAPVVQYSPAVYVANGLAAALDENNRQVTPANPARRGHWIQVYMNGLGPVTNQPASGEPAGANPLSLTLATPAVTIGGKTATVLFSGLTPGLPGLNQVNVVVPQDAPPGMQPVVVTIGGVSSPPVNVPVL